MALEIYESLHVVGVVDAQVSRVFADEGIRRIDRRFNLAAAVVHVDQVELRLASGFTERETRLQAFQPLDRADIVAILHALLRALVDRVRAGLGVVTGAVAAAT